MRSLIFLSTMLLALGCGDNSRPSTSLLPRETADLLEKATELEIQSVDPRANPFFLDFYKGECKMLGKTTVTDKKTRDRILQSLYQSISEGNETAFCFEPRHIIRAKVDGKIVDFVICFECLQLFVYTDGNRGKGIPISFACEKLLNETLTAAGVPLAKSTILKE